MFPKYKISFVLNKSEKQKMHLFVCFIEQKSPRAEPLNVFLRFEYNDGQFSESGKFDVTDGSPREVDHIAILGVNASDPVQADDLGQKPVLSKKKLSNNKRIFVI